LLKTTNTEERRVHTNSENATFNSDRKQINLILLIILKTEILCLCISSPDL